MEEEEEGKLRDDDIDAEEEKDDDDDGVVGRRSVAGFGLAAAGEPSAGTTSSDRIDMMIRPCVCISFFFLCIQRRQKKQGFALPISKAASS